MLLIMVNGKIHSSYDDHVAVFLDPDMKEKIANMTEDQLVMSSFPKESDIEEVTELNSQLKQAGIEEMGYED